MIGNLVHLWRITPELIPHSLLPNPLCTALQCYSYTYVQDPISWYDAKQHCESKDQVLLTFNSYEEYDLILDFIRSHAGRRIVPGVVIYLGLSSQKVIYHLLHFLKSPL